MEEASSYPTGFFHGRFYGRTNFGCKTVRFHEMQRESDSFPLPTKNKLCKAAKHCGNSLGLNYKSAALNQLSYAGVSPDESCFQRLIKSSS
ncbi:MAG: hypothetical protein AUF68_07330 [Verrucomicrobia bacterium 13_1_20CM_54_28]|nr:MAG: hypothetical protein AUF68_07330 [Verrucomicrobia bacterium 13_1_20CM_54_28]